MQMDVEDRLSRVAVGVEDRSESVVRDAGVAGNRRRRAHHGADQSHRPTAGDRSVSRCAASGTISTCVGACGVDVVERRAPGRPRRRSTRGSRGWRCGRTGMSTLKWSLGLVRSWSFAAGPNVDGSDPRDRNGHARDAAEIRFDGDHSQVLAEGDQLPDRFILSEPELEHQQAVRCEPRCGLCDQPANDLEPIARLRRARQPARR